MRLWRAFLVLSLLASVPLAASAQSDDGAYCAALSTLANRYLVSGTGNGSGQPDLETREATIACGAGQYARAIPVLERKLRDARFTLPKRQ